MKQRWLPALFVGLIFGGFAGYGVALLTRPNESEIQKPAAKPDEVIKHVDFDAAIAWAGEGKWTVQRLPGDSLNATEFKPLNATSQGTLCAKSRRYLAKCEQPLTAEEQQKVFNRVVNYVHDAIDKWTRLGNGGGVGNFPLDGHSIYCRHSDFRTEESTQAQTIGGTRGTATFFLISDGKSSTLFLTLTEVTPNAG